jgi:hypothetical protein
MKIFWKITPFCLGLFLYIVTPSYALDITLQWDANSESDLTAYNVYYDSDTGAPYSGTGALEGNSPVAVPLAQDENSDPNIVEVTLHNLPDDIYYFSVRAVNPNGESGFSREVFALDTQSASPYDKGWGITDGDLQGFMVLFNDPDSLTIGPSEEIPPIYESMSGVQGIGTAINLQPSGTHFSPPDYAKIVIPCPGYTDVSVLDLYYYDDNIGDWFLASDANQDWIVGGSRENDNSTNPPTISLKIKHLSGAQAGIRAPAGSPIGGSSTAVVSTAGGGGGGGCFISALQK